MLADVREALGNEVVGRSSTASGGRESSSTTSSTGIVARATRPSSAAPRPCSVNTAGWIPRASSRSSRSDSSSSCLASSSRRRAGGPHELTLQGPELQRERDQPLLRAVVQVSLEPSPLGLRNLDDARARPPQLLHPRAQLGLETPVLERDARRCDDRVQKRRLVLQRGVVHECRHRLPAALDDRGCSAGSPPTSTG